MTVNPAPFSVPLWQTLTIHSYPFVHILPLRQRDGLAKVPAAERLRCILHQIMLMRSFWNILLRLERLARLTRGTAAAQREEQVLGGFTHASLTHRRSFLRGYSRSLSSKHAAEQRDHLARKRTRDALTIFATGHSSSSLVAMPRSERVGGATYTRSQTSYQVSTSSD